jgi:hypothetical protein
VAVCVSPYESEGHRGHERQLEARTVIVDPTHSWPQLDGSIWVSRGYLKINCMRVALISSWVCMVPEMFIVEFVGTW